MKRLTLLCVIFIGLFYSCQRNGNFELDKVLSLGSETSILIAIDTYLNEKSNYGDQLDLLTDPQKVFLFVENLEREINNGGFAQFYYNSAGNLSHETVEALKVIGAFKTVEVLEKANGQFPDGKVPQDFLTRQDVIDEIESVAEPVWNECDVAFYKYEDPIGSLLLDYVRSNKSAFRN